MLGPDALDESPIFVRLGELKRPTGSEIRVWTGAGRVELREVALEENAACEGCALTLHRSELKTLAGFFAEVLEEKPDALLERKPRRRIGFNANNEE